MILPPPHKVVNNCDYSSCNSEYLNYNDDHYKLIYIATYASVNTVYVAI